MLIKGGMFIIFFIFLIAMVTLFLRLIQSVKSSLQSITPFVKLDFFTNILSVFFVIALMVWFPIQSLQRKAISER